MTLEVDHQTLKRPTHSPDTAPATRTKGRKLLIIFVDDLAPRGLSGPALREGGEHEDRWPEVEAAHLNRLESVMELTQP